MTSIDPIHKLLVGSGLNRQDFNEKVSRSSGPGGQHANKVGVAVRIRHLPTGLTTVGRATRSLHSNRLLAYRELIERIEILQKQNLQKKQALAAKMRRQRARRSFKTKKAMQQAKRLRSEIKHNRNKIDF